MTKRVVIITGAGRGIGHSTAQAFAEAGDHVVLASRSQSELQATAELVRMAGGAATIVHAAGEPAHVSIDELVLGHIAGAL